MSSSGSSSPGGTKVSDHRRQALRQYASYTTADLKKKTGTLAIRLRALNQVYLERTGRQLLPMTMDQQLKVYEGLAIPGG